MVVNEIKKYKLDIGKFEPVLHLKYAVTFLALLPAKALLTTGN